MLDTNICIYLMKQQDEHIAARFRQHTSDTIYISSITLAELEFGVSNSTRPERNRATLTDFIAPLTIVSFDQNAAIAYGPIRTSLRPNLIGAFDMLIAAHAVSLGATLITNNEREFRRVDGLKIENWTKAPATD